MDHCMCIETYPNGCVVLSMSAGYLLYEDYKAAAKSMREAANNIELYGEVNQTLANQTLAKQFTEVCKTTSLDKSPVQIEKDDVL